MANLFENLPHVADYMGVDDEEKLSKFMPLIYEEIKIRIAKAN